ncbi:MAG: YkgJ family cysteine cluster protein [Chitinispirillaceae bacterium]|jgi:Fe-S-cluster containining protein|nr:YkgJ family cysteine cluster protein [Chitinispirillaceae bacterium]
MPETTILALTDTLPLTCTREGTCCHGKRVWLNPWELAQMADAKSMAARAFCDQYCEAGGIRLRFDNPPGFKGLPACSQYVPGLGCSVHEARPLVCRLYPLGRERRGKNIRYMHQGNAFPCLEGCPNVKLLPRQTVANYLAGQDINAASAAADGYLELMQQLADGAFALLFESGLAASGDYLTLPLWRTLGTEDPDLAAERLGTEWLSQLMLPDISAVSDDTVNFCRQHHDILQTHSQMLFGKLDDSAALREASGVMMALALHLGRGLGANPAELAAHWIATAKELGGREYS